MNNDLSISSQTISEVKTPFRSRQSFMKSSRYFKMVRYINGWSDSKNIFKKYILYIICPPYHRKIALLWQLPFFTPNYARLSVKCEEISFFCWVNRVFLNELYVYKIYLSRIQNSLCINNRSHAYGSASERYKYISIYNYFRVILSNLLDKIGRNLSLSIIRNTNADDFRADYVQSLYFFFNELKTIDKT